MTTDLSLPSAVDAERAFLGAVLIDSLTLEECPSVQAADFEIHRHRDIWNAITELVSEGRAVDNLTVAHRLEDMGRLGEAGGTAYLAQLITEPASSQHAPTYAAIVTETAMRRRLIAEGAALAKAGYSGEAPAAAALERAIALQALAVGGATSITSTAAEAASEAYDRIAAYIQHGELPGVTTGFSGLDRKTWGLRRGELTVLAGRPGMGKTSLAALMSVKQARAGLRVGVCSLEEKRATWLEASALAELGRNKMQLTPDDLGLLLSRLDEYAALPLHFYDRGQSTLAQVTAAGRQMARDLGGLDVLWLDHLGYINHMAGAKQQNLAYMIGQTTKGLASLAKELNCALVALCQLNRDSARTGKEPTLTDLRDSGEIEQDARTVWFIHRPGYYAEVEPPADKPEPAWLNVSKNNSGPTGRFNLAFVRACRQFTEWSGGIPR